MHLKPIVQGLAAVWLLLFLVSLVALRVGDADGSFASGLSRIVAFLTWQVIAVAVAALGALLARRAGERGAAGVKLVGYGPLGVSMFVLVAFIVIMAYRFALVPFLESLGLL